MNLNFTTRILITLSSLFYSPSDVDIIRSLETDDVLFWLWKQKPVNIHG